MRACVVLFLSSLALWAVPSFAEDDGTAEAPPPPAIPVSARASVTPSSCRVGGTVTYALETAWSAPPGRFVLPAPVEAPLAQGLDLRTRSEKSSKAAGAGGDESRHTMTAVYACVEPGSFALGPVTVKYEDGGGTTGEAVAEAVNVEVLPGMIAAARSSKPVKIAAFVGGLLAFWLTVWLVRRRRKLSAASVVERAAEVRPNAAWEALESEARERPEGSFYARLEELVWSDVFRPDAVPPGTAATRLAELAAHGANQPAVDAVRRIVDDCQKRRYGGGTVSQGDAIDALRAAREAVRAVRGDA